MSNQDIQTIDAFKAEIERLKAENAKLNKTVVKGLSMKVSAKQALSVYGLGRFPITLYKAQWLRLLDISDTIKAFIKANDSALADKKKPEAKAA